MQRVYRLVKEACERGIIPWPCIIDDRQMECVSSWSAPEAYARYLIRRDY
jgi:hypothetical protein